MGVHFERQRWCRFVRIFDSGGTRKVTNRLVYLKCVVSPFSRRLIYASRFWTLVKSSTFYYTAALRLYIIKHFDRSMQRTIFYRIRYLTIELLTQQSEYLHFVLSFNNPIECCFFLLIELIFCCIVFVKMFVVICIWCFVSLLSWKTNVITTCFPLWLQK